MQIGASTFLYPDLVTSLVGDFEDENDDYDVSMKKAGVKFVSKLQVRFLVHYALVEYISSYSVYVFVFSFSYLRSLSLSLSLSVSTFELLLSP